MRGAWLLAGVVAAGAGQVRAEEAAKAPAADDEAPGKQQVHDERLFASPFFEGPAQLFEKKDAEVDLYAHGTFLKEDWQPSSYDECREGNKARAEACDLGPDYGVSDTTLGLLYLMPLANDKVRLGAKVGRRSITIEQRNYAENAGHYTITGSGVEAGLLANYSVDEHLHVGADVEYVRLDAEAEPKWDAPADVAKASSYGYVLPRIGVAEAMGTTLIALHLAPAVDTGSKLFPDKRPGYVSVLGQKFVTTNTVWSLSVRMLKVPDADGDGQKDRRYLVRTGFQRYTDSGKGLIGIAYAYETAKYEDEDGGSGAYSVYWDAFFGDSVSWGVLATSNAEAKSEEKIEGVAFDAEHQDARVATSITVRF